MKFADLHLHTTHSDGTRSPREVIDLARRLGLSIVAISDHDNLGGYFEIKSHADSEGVTLIPAVELSAIFEGVDIHILAYSFDPLDERITERLASFRNTRLNRGHLIVQRLREHGYAISSERVAELAGGGSLGRPHVARALIEAGIVSSFEEAFAKLLGPGCIGYVDKERFAVDEAVTLIRACGGVTSIAHPSVYPDHRRLIPQILDMGVDAIETMHPAVPHEDRFHYEAMAAKRGLFVTAGSDDHGTAKTKETIGTIRIAETKIGEILKRLAPVSPVHTSRPSP